MYAKSTIKTNQCRRDEQTVSGKNVTLEPNRVDALNYTDLLLLLERCVYLLEQWGHESSVE